MVGCNTGSTEKVQGERKPVISDDEDHSNPLRTMCKGCKVMEDFYEKIQFKNEGWPQLHSKED
jgi:hypothetical protein